MNPSPFSPLQSFFSINPSVDEGNGSWGTDKGLKVTPNVRILTRKGWEKTKQSLTKIVGLNHETSSMGRGPIYGLYWAFRREG